MPYDLPPLSRRYRVGIRLLDWSQGFGFRLFPGILEVARTSDLIDLEFEQPSGSDLATTVIDENWEGDGLLVFRYSATEAAAWKKKGIAVVNLSAEHPASNPVFPRITMDNDVVGAMAARHFITLGLRRFAYWHDPHRNYSIERLEGYRRELSKHGFHDVQVFEIPSSRYPEDLRAQKNIEQGRQALSALQAPTGLFAKDDIGAICAMRALAQLGLRCPRDIPVLGVADDMVYCAITRPPLSSVRYPGKTIGSQAMQLLLRMMQGETVPDQTRVLVPPKQLVVRESTGLVEFSDEVVTKALHFIRNASGSRGVSVDELCRAAGVSRELLRQRFRHVLGRSPKEEIDRQRLEIVRDHLRRTTWTIDRIAAELGFTAADELCRFFKRVEGITPGEFRKSVH